MTVRMFAKVGPDRRIVCEQCLDEEDTNAVLLRPEQFPGTWQKVMCSECGTHAVEVTGTKVAAASQRRG